MYLYLLVPVLTDETVADITLSGYAGVFQLPIADQHNHLITHIKSEIIHDDAGDSYIEDHQTDGPGDPGEPSHLVNPGRVIMQDGNMILEQNVTNVAGDMSNDGGEMNLEENVTNNARDMSNDGGKMNLEENVMSNQVEPEADIMTKIRRKVIKSEQLIPPVKMITDYVGNKKSKLKFKCSLCNLELQAKSTLELHCKICHEQEWIEFQRADCSSTSDKISKFQTSCQSTHKL